jgi:hypothetical protein
MILQTQYLVFLNFKEQKQSKSMSAVKNRERNEKH